MNTPKNLDLALLLIRIGVGLIFIYAGWNKLTGIEGTTNYFDGLGVPVAGVMAWVVAIVEFVGGIMVLTGFRIELPAILLAVVMVFAIILTKIGIDNMFRAMRLDLLLLLCNVALMLTGAGKYAIGASGKSD